MRTYSDKGPWTSCPLDLHSGRVPSLVIMGAPNPEATGRGVPRLLPSMEWSYD